MNVTAIYDGGGSFDEGEDIYFVGGGANTFTFVDNIQVTASDLNATGAGLRVVVKKGYRISAVDTYYDLSWANCGFSITHGADGLPSGFTQYAVTPLVYISASECSRDAAGNLVYVFRGFHNNTDGHPLRDFDLRFALELDPLAPLLMPIFEMDALLPEEEELAPPPEEYDGDGDPPPPDDGGEDDDDGGEEPEEDIGGEPPGDDTEPPPGDGGE